MLKGMERDGVPHAGTCAKRNKLMVSLTEINSQQFYAPGSPGARKDIPGKRAGTVAVDPNFASWSKPDFEAYLPPWQDGRWWKDGSKIVFNCQMPIPAGALQQAESFLECARVYSCGAAAAMCGRELARTTNTSDCASISRTCLAANPVPSGTVQSVARRAAAQRAACRTRYKRAAHPAAASTTVVAGRDVAGVQGPVQCLPRGRRPERQRESHRRL